MPPIASYNAQAPAQDIAELLTLNAQLRAELERTRRERDFFEADARGMSSVAAVSTDYYWEQDEFYRFQQIITGHESVEPRQQLAEGLCRWELPDAQPVHMTWDEHRAMLDAREPFRDFEYSVLLDHGVRHYVSASGSPAYDDDNRFIGYRGTTRSIDKTQEVANNLRQSEVRFQAVIATLAEAVILRDKDGVIVDCNDSAEKLFGRRLAEIKGGTSVDAFWQLLREDGSAMPREERPSVMAMRTGLPQVNRIARYRRPSGADVWVQLNVRPLLDAQGGVITGYVSSLSDISDLKRREQEIVRLNTELENRVVVRTTELEAVNAELKSFSYAVAHDLRGPLVTISGFCALLRKAAAADTSTKQQDYLLRIHTGAQKMMQLIDGLLFLAQISNTSLRTDSIDLAAQAHALLAQHAENEPGRVVRVVVEPGLLAVGDNRLTRQLLANLIGNAWKFTSKKPEAEIAIGRQIDAAGAPVFYVRDNGAGFDMAQVDKLFGTFQRLHSENEFAGTGIGLATVRRIVQRHGGTIWATSAVGEGSTFFFTLEGKPSDSEVIPAHPAIPGSTEPIPATDQDVPRPAASELGRSSAPERTLSELQFATAFERSVVGMTLKSLDGVCLRANVAICKMLGYSESEILVRPVQALTHADDIAEDELLMNRALAGEIETYQREKRAVHRSGHVVWVDTTCSLIRDSDRKPLHFLAQFVDITDKKQREQTLRDQERQLLAMAAVSCDSLMPPAS